MYTDTRSAQPCGCDEGAKHICEWHTKMIKAASGPAALIAKYVEDRSAQEAYRKTSAMMLSIGGAPTRATTLPVEASERKKYPMATGVLSYFPKALAEIARVSFVGNEQHNPGQPLHWDRAKSADEADALIRHFMERGSLDKDGLRHSAKVAWRALALLEKEIEAASDPSV